MPLLGKALAIEPDYAGAHSWLALCHESLYVRAGFRGEDRTAAIHHARAAITHGRDDATALALGAFVVALVEHDRVTASTEGVERGDTVVLHQRDDECAEGERRRVVAPVSDGRPGVMDSRGPVLLAKAGAHVQGGTRRG